jgi:hypothetical protein
MLSQIRPQARRLRETPHLPGLDLATAWHRETDVFAAEEIGWVFEEARRTCARLFGPHIAGAVIHDAHLATAGFALLAAHPRIRGRAQRILGTAVALETCLVICARAATLPRTRLLGEAMIVVPLAPTAAERPGTIFQGTTPPITSRHDWPFIALYRTATATCPSSDLPDDALWPDPSFVAG